MLTTKTLTDIDPMERIEHVYPEGSYERRWTGTRYDRCPTAFFFALAATLIF